MLRIQGRGRDGEKAGGDRGCWWWWVLSEVEDRKRRRKECMKATCFDKYCVLVCVVPDTIRGLEHLPSCCIREIVNQCIMRLTRLEEQTCHKFQSRMTPCVLKEEKKKERISPYKWMLFSAAEFPFCINLTSHYHKPALPLLVASQ